MSMKFFSATLQMRATEQYFSCGAVYYALQGACNFLVYYPKLTKFTF